MEQRYKDRSIYFKEQSYTTKKYVIPFLQQSMEINENIRLLEIGCGEGGNLLPFLELGIETVGVDIQEKQVLKSIEFLDEYVNKNKYRGLANDIYDLNNSQGEDIGKFDLIIMRDVIEHIHDQNKFMSHLKKFLKPEGKVFFGYPPWYMPFGGHQQILNNKARKLPWIHILPRFLYVAILKMFGTDPHSIDNLLEIKDTGITIERFRRIVKNNAYKMDVDQLWLYNPNYEIKFGLKPKKQWWLLTKIPFFRNFITTCNYAIISM